MLITLGTDCTGVDAAFYALKKCLASEHQIEYKFASEIDPALRRYLRDTVPVETVYEDICLRDNFTAPSVDIYVAWKPGDVQIHMTHIICNITFGQIHKQPCWFGGDFEQLSYITLDFACKFVINIRMFWENFFQCVIRCINSCAICAKSQCAHRCVLSRREFICSLQG